MRDIKVASRFAKSLLKIAIDEKVLDDVYKDILLVNSACADNYELSLLLKSPIVKTDKKKIILHEIFGNQVSKISNSFISIILLKKRESLLFDITSAFIDAYKVHKGITTATVTTAIPLSSEQKSNIIGLLKNEGRSNIDLKEVVSENIIGGMILRIGDKQYDESIRRKLTNLGMEFDENPYVKEF